MSKSVKLRVEEYVPMAMFLMKSFERDRTEMASRFKEFTSDYQNAFGVQLEKVSALEQTINLTREQKNTTAALYALASQMNKELNFLAFWMKSAGLDRKVLTGVKRDLLQRNIEGACLKMAGLVQLVQKEAALLESKGMGADFVQRLIDVKNDLEKHNALQNEIMDIRGQLYEDNSRAYKLLHGYISTIAEAGKIMYDGLGKRDEYTLRKLLSRMRAGVR